MTTTNAMIRPWTPREAVVAFHLFGLPLRSFDDSMRLLCRSILFLPSHSYLARWCPAICTFEISKLQWVFVRLQPLLGLLFLVGCATASPDKVHVAHNQLFRGKIALTPRFAAIDSFDVSLERREVVF